MNSYIIGDPVEGDAFVGRDDIMNQLSFIWSKSSHSVLLYGHRRMGKTSILKNINDQLQDKVILVYVHMPLASCGFIASNIEAEILIFICNEIYLATQLISYARLPSDEEFTLSPEATCRRYIQAVIEKIGQRKLIIAIDEYEQIGELIATNKLSTSFLTFLNSLVKLGPNIAFVFAGLHSFEEESYSSYSDLFPDIISIRIGFLSLDATRQLLANPANQNQGFPLSYTPETLDRIHQLTAGQPYLTQLVGFQLVRHYHEQAFEEGQMHSPILTIDDLETVITDPVFFDRGRSIFIGIWGEASQGIPHQQTILVALAPHPTGLSLEELSSTTNLGPAELTSALGVLERRDVVVTPERGVWRISIELFRRWVINYSQEE